MNRFLLTASLLLAFSASAFDTDFGLVSKFKLANGSTLYKIPAHLEGENLDWYATSLQQRGRFKVFRTLRPYLIKNQHTDTRSKSYNIPFWF
jgi:hypothetical protein